MFCLGVPFIKKMLWGGTARVKKSLVFKITATRCSLCLLFSIKRERVAGKGKRKDTVISRWTSQLLHGRSPSFLSSPALLSRLDRLLVINAQDFEKLGLLRSIKFIKPLNSLRSNKWMVVFITFLSSCVFPFLCTSLWVGGLMLELGGSGVWFLGLPGLKGSCGRHGTAVANCKMISARMWPCEQRPQRVPRHPHLIAHLPCKKPLYFLRNNHKLCAKCAAHSTVRPLKKKKKERKFPQAQFLLYGSLEFKEKSSCEWQTSVPSLKAPDLWVHVNTGKAFVRSYAFQQHSSLSFLDKMEKCSLHHDLLLSLPADVTSVYVACR